MYTNTFVRASYDFGAPFVSLRLMHRSRQGREFLEGLARLKLEGKEDHDLIAAYVQAFIGKWRPDLAGCIVMIMGARPMQGWEFQVIHHSLPRLPMGSYREEYIETCPVCKKPLPVPGEVGVTQMYLAPVDENGVYRPGTAEHVCSAECAEPAMKQGRQDSLALFSKKMESPLRTMFRAVDESVDQPTVIKEVLREERSYHDDEDGL